VVISAGAEGGGDLRFGVLGPLEVARRGAPVQVGGPMRRALLAMLLLRPGEVVSLGRLVEDLWSGRPPSGARATLQSHVSHLRRDLGVGAECLVARPPGYRLDVDAAAVDVGEFEQALDTALRLGSPQAVSTRLTAALALWRGPALVEFAAMPWAAPEIARLEARHALAVEAWAEAELTLGRHVAVLAELERLAEAEPLREVRWILLLTALQRAGRHVEATRAAHRYRMLLRDAGLDPSPSFDDVEQALLRHEPIAPPATIGAHPAEVVPSPRRSGQLPLVGRQRELATLRAALDAAGQGHPGLVLVSGEPGVGKTRLVRELADLARTTDATVLVGRCDDGLAVPYQPFVEALQAFVGWELDDLRQLEARLGGRPEALGLLAPDILRALPHLRPSEGHPDLERYHLFEAVRSWLATLSTDRHVLLVVEDLHWASRPTLLLLRHVLRSLKEERLCIVTTCRSTEVEPRSDNESLLIDIARDLLADTVPLRGLDEGEVGELIDLWPGRLEGLGPDLPAQVFAATAGNPFFVEEILRHLGEAASLGIPAGAAAGAGAGAAPAGLVPFPPSLHEVVRQRVGRLSSATEALLIRAAILGQEFSARVLLEMVRDRPDAAGSLEAARRAGFIEPVADSSFHYRFCHAVVREVLVTGLPDVQQALLHRDAGIALEALAAGGSDPPLVELAEHFTAAIGVGEAARAVRYSRRAGDQALERYAADEAVVHYRTALEHVDHCADLDEHDRCDLLMDLGEAQRRLPDPSHRETFLEAARAARELGNQGHLARAAKGIARGFQLASGPDPERVEVIEAAVASYGDAIDATKARLLASLAGEIYLAGRYDEGEALMEQAVRMARVVGDVPIMTITQLMQWDLVWHPATFRARQEMERRLIELAVQLDAPELQARTASVTFVHALESGRGAAAAAALREIERLAADDGGPYIAWMVPVLRSILHTAAGRLEDAQREATAAVEASRGDGRPGVEIAVLGQLIQLAAFQEQLGTFEPILAPAAGSLTSARALLARAWAQMGRAEEAGDLLEAMIADGEVFRVHDITWPVGVMALADVAWRVGATEPARTLFDVLLPYREQFVASCFYFLGPVAQTLGDLTATLGEVDAAADWYADAERRAAAFPSPLFVERARAARARLAVADRPSR